MDDFDPSNYGIAIIGMAGRFPGARDLATFWRNLCDGVEAITAFSDEELLAAGEDPAVLSQPHYVKAGGVLDAIERFDAAFFGFTPREAEVLDPQQRLFLECAWEALEQAGYIVTDDAPPIGVFAGSGISTYLLMNLYPNRALMQSLGEFQIVVGNEKDFLPTRVSHLLNLKGPSVNVQTACSTSLVAVHLACQSLLNAECDLALAGGVSIRVPHRVGYVHGQGSILSPDGHCRAFAADAQGTVPGNGAGVVVLKRLADALADGDTIHAVIKGFAINNDGAIKVSYTAPSVAGQAAVITEALSLADVEPETVSYIEAHGTGTALGDPIEIAALTQAFGSSARRGSCAVGSLKSNVGHLDAAAGVAGLIKTVLALKHRQLPPSLHCATPNPQIDFAATPFCINTELRDWPAGPTPRRAGVSSFGIGGTNAHVVVEEAPPAPEAAPARPWQLLVLSAATPSALETLSADLAEHLAASPAQALADVAYTLHVGRRPFRYRRAVVCASHAQAQAALTGAAPQRVLTGQAAESAPPVVFLLPGLGEQYVGMGRELYQHEPVFREHVERCAELLQPQLGCDLRAVLYPNTPSEAQPGTDAAPSIDAARPALDLRRLLGRAADPPPNQLLDDPAVAHAALFVVEYALAQQWQSWGIQPQVLLGYSLGEYIAACLAGVFTLEDALALVVQRARLIASLPRGAMLAVPLAADALRPLLPDDLAIAALNGPDLCVVAGTSDTVAALADQLRGKGIASRRLATTHALHSPLMEPIVARFRALVAQTPRQAPQIRYLSNVTGTWITPEQATDPAYWARHLCEPVRLDAALATVLADTPQALVEVGPGYSLGSAALHMGGAGSGRAVVPSLPPGEDGSSALTRMLTSLGQLWLAGVAVAWPQVSAPEPRRRIPLPTYPFERQRYWIDPLTWDAADQALPALPTIDAALTQHARPNLPNAYVAPETPLERLLSVIWIKLLGIEPIGIHDNFFAMGGHSLIATQIVTAIRDQLHVDLPLRTLFEAPTVAELAVLVEQAQQLGTEQQAPPLVPVARDGALPLSSAQERLHFLDQLVPNNPAFHIPAAVRVEGTLVVAALEATLNQIIRRHEALRTTFAQGSPITNGQPVQVIAPALTIQLTVRDLQDLPDATQEPELTRLILAEAQRPFDLARGPLVRCALFTLAPQMHVLLLTMHHIISDGWSGGVLVQEIAALYPAYLAGDPDAAERRLPELPIQYADYAVWQRQWMQGAVLEEQLSYWQRQLADVPVLELPTDRPRPAVQTFHGATHRFLLAKPLADALTALSQREDVTLFMTLLAAYQTLLGRYASQDDFAVGTPVANRMRAELEQLIGCFVNMVVMRADLGGNPSFREVLHRVRQVALGAYTHQDVPFEQVVDVVQPRRDLSYTPLFQVVFILQNTPMPVLELPGLILREQPVESGGVQFDLVLNLLETPEGLKGWLEYNTDLFEAATIARLIAHFQMLLEAVVAQPDQPIAALPLLTEAEHHLLLHDWTATAAPYPAECSLPQLFAAQVMRTPEALAVLDGAQRLTYRELDARSSRLAWHLHALGVRAETRVGVCVERSVAAIVALLGVLKAGGAYVPLDPAYPQARLHFMLEDAQVALVLTQRIVREQVPTTSLPVLCLDTLALDRYPVTPPPIHVLPDQLAYVIYTSGSTGTPKGVLGLQRGVVNRLQWMWTAYPFAPEERCCQKTALSFVDSVWEIFGPLLHGVPVRVLADEVVRDPVQLVRALAEQRITRIVLVPSLLRALLDTHPNLHSQLPQLTGWVSSGEALPLDVARRFAAQLPHATLLNLYGSSEVAADASWFDIRQLARHAQVPIGRPLANVAVYVLDRRMQPVPLGVSGEVYVGGAGLARGYLNRPDLTAERFVPHPYGTTPGARLYRTGDRARWLPDGQLEYLGRLDQQVKVRGFRIELGEIESALLAHPGVREAVVVAREVGASDTRLVAYVVENQDQHPEGPRNQDLRTKNQADPGSQFSVLGSADLRQHVGARLPGYMVPSAFVVLDALPLLPNGKVDRRALPQPERAGDTTTLVAPRTEVETALARIWAEVLGRERVGVEENFFDAGGHSLLGTQVMSRVRQTLGVELPLRALFEAPTIAGLAQRVAAVAESSRTALPPIQPARREGDLPLSFGQQRLWFLDQLQPGQSGYTIATAVRLSGALDVAALRQSLNAVVERHEALRTTFAQRDGRASQVIVPSLVLALPLVDLSALPAAERAAQAERLVAAAAQQPFDLERGPLLHTRLLRLEGQTHLLLLVIHHIVCDGWSLGVLVRELAAVYAAQTSTTAAAAVAGPVRTPLPIQYADYALWQRTALEPVLEAQLGYWRQQLAGAPTVLELPTDRPRPAVPTLRGAQHRVTLPTAVREGVQRLSQQAGATPFMTLLAAFNVLLHRYTGQADIVVGTPIANRNRAETEGLIGFFVNTLALRTDLHGQPSFRELLARVRAVALEAYAHQDLPFERLVDALQLPRDLSRPPLFQVLFVLQNAPLPPLNVAELTLEPVAIESRTSRFDLTLELLETDQGLAATFEYSTDLFEAATIARLAQHWQMLLEAVVAQPDQPIAALPLLTEAEHRLLLHDWNDTTRPYPVDRCFHDSFAAQAGCAPDALAVLDGAQRLTYRELDERSSRLAWHLHALGVRAETRVGVCVERSVDLVIALLAIHKAGGAYVPLDPAYPQARLHFMLEDAQVALVLTQRIVRDQVPATSAAVLCLDTLALDHYPVTPPPVCSLPDQLAYVIYTSGSTGTPKGVMLAHRGLSNLLFSRIRELTAQAGSRMLHFASISFDAAIFELCIPLAAGATLYLAPQADLLPGPTLQAYLQRHAITTVALPPSALAVTSAADLPALQTVIAAGEACPAPIVASWAPDRCFINGYGPTESTVCATFAVCQPDGRTPPIGRPLTNLTVYVLDRRMQPVPLGVSGEVYVGGAGLARGYLNRPDLTAERFVPHPYGATPGARLYRTGDRARWLPDGQLEFMGRIDQQIKLRGFRIELGEIESALLAHPAVQSAAVDLRETRVGHPQIVAYVVQNKEQRTGAPWANKEHGEMPDGSWFSVLGSSELREFLGARLPGYMVPSAFVTLDALPLTPNGKVDRRALPQPERAGEVETAAVAPRSEVETALARIWAEVLDIEHVGIHDNFFALGGDSILGIQIVARANQAGLHLTPGQLFQHQTIAELASIVTVTQAADAETDAAPGPVPLTPIQHWLFEQDLPNPQHFNQSLLLEPRQPLDFALLEQAVQQLAQHHTALRLRFVHDGPSWQQLDPGDTPAIPCLHVDLSAVAQAEHRTAIEQTAADVQASLNLARGPLMRVVLFACGADQAQRLLLVIHHLVIDGVSWRILMDDLQTAYSLASGAAVLLPPRTTSFQRWAAQLNAYAQTDALRAELPYWLRLADRSLPSLPLDNPGGANLVASVREITLTLDAEETRALLHDVPPVYHTQINDVLLTALLQGFAAWTGQHTLLLDMEGHGREDVLADVDLSRTVGWFTSIFPVALELPPGSDPGAALKAVKEHLRQIPRRGIGYGLLRYLSSDDDAARLRMLPRAEINFNYLGQTDQSLASSLFTVASESSGPNVDPQAQRPYLLEISGIVSGGQLRLQWLYSEQLHQHATIEAFAQHSLAALRTLIQHCLAPDAGGYTPSDFPAARVSQGDLNKLLGLIGSKGGPTAR